MAEYIAVARAAMSMDGSVRSDGSVRFRPPPRMGNFHSFSLLSATLYSPPHVQPPRHDPDADDAPVPGGQGAASRRPPDVPHGRLLRDVLRGRPPGGAHPGGAAHRPPEGDRERDADVRRAPSRAGGLSRQAPRRRAQGGDLRSGGGPGAGQGAGQARGDPRGHPGHGVRSRRCSTGRRRTSSPAWSGSASAGAGRLPRPLDRHLLRPPLARRRGGGGGPRPAPAARGAVPLRARRGGLSRGDRRVGRARVPLPHAARRATACSIPSGPASCCSGSSAPAPCAASDWRKASRR